MKNRIQKESSFVRLAGVYRVVFVFYIVLASFIYGNASAYAQNTTCHTVRPGETLTTIAARYGTSVSAIVQSSGIPNINSIRVGQQLCFVTSRSDAEVALTVTPANLSPVVTVTPVPAVDTSSSSAPTPTVAPRVVPTQPSTVYIVRRGDSLLRISRLYGVSVAQLMAYNSLNSTTIYTGQTIRIPPR